MNPNLLRPQPILSPAAEPVDQHVSAHQAAKRLRDGEFLIVTDHYHTGIKILDELAILLKLPDAAAPYALRQSAQRTHRAASLRLLAPIKDHRLALSDANAIGFLQELYPEESRFVLPFVEVQQLHGAWSRYREGIHLAVLGHCVHPFFGTYVPTRTSHLELFGTWLSQYTGPRARAIDVGTGCGVLAFMLCRAGFENVCATDNNPNAIESVVREIERMKSSPPLVPLHTDLLGEDPDPYDLVVFNPPWMKGQPDGLVDQALFFEEGLFERFFDQACTRIHKDGRIVMLFSNVIQLVQPDVPHPILSELERGRLQLVQKIQRKVKPPRNENGPRRRTRERVEVWELARVR